MCEGDFGLALPIAISGTTFTANDEIKLTIKASVNGAALVEKTFADIADNTVSFMLTEEESKRLHVGAYVYALDWYQDGAFMCNIIPRASLRVVDKA